MQKLRKNITNLPKMDPTSVKNPCKSQQDLQIESQKMENGYLNAENGGRNRKNEDRKPENGHRNLENGHRMPQSCLIRWARPQYPEFRASFRRIPGATLSSNISAPGLKAPEACRMVEVGLLKLPFFTHPSSHTFFALTFFAHCGVCVEGLYVSC